MKNCWKSVKNALFLILFLILSSAVHADQREENIELFLVLDKSKSMVQEIGEVVDYVDNFLLNTFLIPGDRLAIITFYGQTELFFQPGVVDDQSRMLLSSSLSRLKADGRFTDIGNALDRLNGLVSRETTNTGLKRYLLLITDGIQEAPPESPYYSPDGSFNHRFLETTKEIQNKGWKIVILGIGQETAAREVAEELDGIYREITGTVDSRGLEEATEDLLKMITLTDYSQDLKIDKTGKANVKLLLENLGFSEAEQIVITSVNFEDGRSHALSLSTSSDYPQIIEFHPEETREFVLPLDFSGRIMGEESVSGTLHFEFGSDNRFTPAFISVNLIPARKVSSLWWILVPLFLLLIITFYLVRKRRHPGQPSRLPLQTISVTLEGDLKAQRVFKVRPGDTVFLKKDSFGIALVKEQVASPLARLLIRLEEIIVDLDKGGELKALSSLEGNILDRKLSFRLKDNQRFTLQVKRNNETK